MRLYCIGAIWKCAAIEKSVKQLDNVRHSVTANTLKWRLIFFFFKFSATDCTNTGTTID